MHCYLFSVIIHIKAVRAAYGSGPALGNDKQLAPCGGAESTKQRDIAKRSAGNGYIPDQCSGCARQGRSLR